MPANHTPTSLAVSAGQTVRVYAGGELLASAVRHGRGWGVLVNGQHHQVATLDGVLALLGLLPEHHR